jgi:hypothetical protein
LSRKEISLEQRRSRNADSIWWRNPLPVTETEGSVIIFKSQPVYFFFVWNSQLQTTTSDSTYLRIILIAPFRLGSSNKKQPFTPAISPSSVSLPKYISLRIMQVIVISVLYNVLYWPALKQSQYIYFSWTRGVISHPNNIGGNFKTFPESLHLWEIQNSTINLSYISFEIFPLCNNTILQATTKL